MHKKFGINRTKIKGGCQSERKVVTHNSKSDLLLDNTSLLSIDNAFFCSPDIMTLLHQIVVDICVPGYFSIVIFLTDYNNYRYENSQNNATNKTRKIKFSWTF